MNVQETAFAYVGAFIEELARSGIRNVCVCPGSRSTPLAMLLDVHSDIRVWMHIDERSAAFFALGMAKSSGEPVALLCSSGTAAANFYPAVVEARYGRVPLIVLTADRPNELREIGAPQTIDQVRIYGGYAKWAVDMGLPENTPSVISSVRSIACRAVAVALDAPAGPVHINFPFREPLVPLLAPPAGAPRLQDRPYVRVPTSRRVLGEDVIPGLVRDLTGFQRGIIVCGPQDDTALPEAVADLARALGFPILADPLSGVRCGIHDRSLVIDAYDAFLRDVDFATTLDPDVVVRFGAIPTSKPLVQFLERTPGRQIVVDAGAGWRDPTLTVDEMLWSDPVWLCRALTDALTPEGENIAWQEKWLKANRVAREAIERILKEMDEPFEGSVFAALGHLLPERSILWVGSSMPVRDLDTFLPSNRKAIRFLANRGANGIDGVVSSALGVAASSNIPVTLVLGDLSFYHDLNGLLAARRHEIDITIVVLNNDGGGIFSFLPQSEHREGFERLFGTPTGLDFKSVVRMYGGVFERVQDIATLQETFGRKGTGLRVFEVVTDRERNVLLHRQVWTAVHAALPMPAGVQQ